MLLEFLGSRGYGRLEILLRRHLSNGTDDDDFDGLRQHTARGSSSIIIVNNTTTAIFEKYLCRQSPCKYLKNIQKNK
jgi:hypothetical protein